METILITGGCGFIGTSLIGKLIKKKSDLKIRVLDNYSVGTPEDLKSVSGFIECEPKDCDADHKLILIEGNIQDFDTVLYCTKNVDCIVHLAANTGVGLSVADPRQDMECNVVGTFNMLEAARINKVKKFIFASSGAPAGEVDPPIHEELAPHPVSPYGASKLAGEGFCSAYYKTFGVNTVCLRFGNVYGPKSKKKSSVVAKFIQQALKDTPCIIYGDGTQTRDFIYIDDLINAVIQSISKNVGGEIFQIATGMECTIQEIGAIISRGLLKHGKKMIIQNDSPRLGDVKRNFSDVKKAKAILNWSAKVPLEEGIEKTLEYFLKEKENIRKG